MLTRRSRILATALALFLGVPGLAGAASLSIDFTINGEPLSNPDHGKFYIYEVEKRENYLAWGNSMKSATVPEGEYDVLVKYRNDSILVERWWTEVDLTSDASRKIDFPIVLARLNLQVVSGGLPIDPFSARYSVFPAGRAGQPVARKRPGESLVLRQGTYDIEVSVRDAKGLQSTWLRDVSIQGEYSETVEIGAQPARLRLTLLEDGVAVNAGRGVWRLYPTGTRTRSVAEGLSGEVATVPAGIYDVRLFHRTTRAERWITDVPVNGNVEHEFDLQVADAYPTATAAAGGASTDSVKDPARLRVDILRRGSRQTSGWFSVYARGDRTSPLASAASGGEVEIESGKYDIGCFLKMGQLRHEKWLTNRNVSGSLQLDVGLDVRSASLRVTAPKASGDGSRAPTHLLFLLDSSSTMGGSLDGVSQMEAVRNVLPRVMDRLGDPQVKVGLRAFGIAPASQRNCEDSVLLAPPSTMSGRRLTSTLDLLRPSGLAPLAYSLDQVRTDLDGVSGTRVLVVLTSSGDNCGGAPCAAAARLLNEGVVDRSYVVGLGLPRDQQRHVECVGPYESARSERELDRALTRILTDAAATGTGTVSIFRRGMSEWITGGPINEKLAVPVGTYDVMVQHGGQKYIWNNIEITGDYVAAAGPTPRRQRR